MANCLLKSHPNYQLLEKEYDPFMIDVIHSTLDSAKFRDWYGAGKAFPDGTPVINSDLTVTNTKGESFAVSKFQDVQFHNQMQELKIIDRKYSPFTRAGNRFRFYNLNDNSAHSNLMERSKYINDHFTKITAKVETDIDEGQRPYLTIKLYRDNKIDIEGKKVSVKDANPIKEIFMDALNAELPNNERLRSFVNPDIHPSKQNAIITRSTSSLDVREVNLLDSLQLIRYQHTGPIGDLAEVLHNLFTEKTDPLTLPRVRMVEEEVYPQISGSGTVGSAGVYHHEFGDIFLRSDISEDPITEKHVFLHELLHAVSVMALHSPSNEVEHLFSKNMRDLYWNAKVLNPKLSEEYGMTNVYEFVAEGFSNPMFAYYLKTNRIPGSVKGDSFFRRFVNVVLEFLGFNTSTGSIYDELKEIFDIYTKTIDKVRTSSDDAYTPVPTSLSTPFYAVIDKTPKIKLEELNKAGKYLAKQLDDIYKQSRILKNDIHSKNLFQETDKGYKRIKAIFDKKDYEKGIIEYLKHASKILGDMQAIANYDINKIQNREVFARKVNKTIEFTRSFNALNEFIGDLSTHPEDFENAELLLTEAKKIRDFQDQILPKAIELQYQIIEGHYTDMLKGSKALDNVNVKEALKTLDGDIWQMQYLLNDAGSMPDHLIQMLDLYRKKIEYNLVGMYNNMDTSMTQALEELEKATVGDKNIHGVNPYKYFDFMTEKFSDGKPTGYALSKFNEGEYNKDKTAAVEKFKKDHPEASDADIANAGLAFHSGHRSNYLNKEYETLMSDPKLAPQREFYKYWAETYIKLQEMYPQGSKMGSRLPGVFASDDERLYRTDKKLKKISEIYLPSPTDTSDVSYGFTDAEGKPVDFIPILFTQKGINPEDISYDLATSLIKYGRAAMKYSAFNEGMGIINSTIDIANRRKVIQYKGGKPSVDPVSIIEGKMVESNGTISNSAKYLDQWRKMFIYGQFKEDEGTWDFFGRKISKAKLADQLLKYSSINALSFNMYSAFSNVATGGAMTRAEASANRFFGHKNLVEADAVFFKNATGLFKDFGQRHQTGFLNAWERKFNVHQDLNAESIRKDRRFTSKVGQGFTPRIMYAMSSVGDFYSQIRVSFATAMKQTIEVDGKKVRLFDTLELRNGEIEVKSEYKDIVTHDMLFKFSTRVNKLNKGIFGIYTDLDQSVLQRTIAGRLMMLFRRWIVPGFNRRWEGKKFDFELDGSVEGHYRTTLRLVTGADLISNTGKWITSRFNSEMKEDLKSLQFNVLSNWNEMEDWEKGNVWKTLTEIAYIAGAAILGTFILGMADDEPDNKTLNFIAYQTNRLYSEMFFYTNPNEFIKILQSPSATVNTIQNIWNLFNFFHWFDEIESGKHKGEYKIERDMKKLIPMYRTFERINDPHGELANFIR